MKDNNQDNDFIKNFRHIWADNGDAISYHYTGTGSTHTEYLCIDLALQETAREDGLGTSSTNTKPLQDFITKISGISTK